MSDDLTKIEWNVGIAMRDPTPMFGGMRIIQNDHMSADEIAILAGEAVMGSAKYAALMKHVQSKVDEQVTGAILGAKSILPQKPDPEVQAMQSNELWGAF